MYIGDVDSTVELYISRWNISLFSQMRSTNVVGQYTYRLGLKEPPPEDDLGLYLGKISICCYHSQCENKMESWIM